MLKLEVRSPQCVNLPRWGLKRRSPEKINRKRYRVNLPRWGLKRKVREKKDKLLLCKFTPLGFETSAFPSMPTQRSFSVNLPRWSLKLSYRHLGLA